IQQQPPANPTLAQLRARIRSGRHWMVTPYRTLTLVHAVQQPLIATKLDNLHLEPPRQLGWTYAMLGDQVQAHGKSTAKWNVRAIWQEWVDPLGEDGPRVVDGKAEAFEAPLQPTDE